MRRAAASSCAMQMHLVLQSTGEQRPRYELSLLVRFNSTGLLARPWCCGVDQTCLSFASSRLPRLSMHSVHRVECGLGSPHPFKIFALSLSNASSRTSKMSFIFKLEFSSLSFPSFITHLLESLIVAIKCQLDLIFRTMYRCSLCTLSRTHRKFVIEKHLTESNLTIQIFSWFFVMHSSSHSLHDVHWVVTRSALRSRLGFRGLIALARLWQRHGNFDAQLDLTLLLDMWRNDSYFIKLTDSSI